MARRTTISIATLLDTAGLSKGVDQAGGILGKFGGKAKLLAAGGAAAAGAAFVKGFTDGMGREALEGRFGADVVEGAAAVYRDAWGESLEDVAAQFAEAQRAFGDSADLEALTGQAYALAERYDRDVSTSIEDARELAESFGLDASHAMDLVAASLDSAPASIRDELSAATREYGGFFADLGLSAEQTLSFLENMGEGGALALDKAGDAIKELTIRGTDMSATSQEAFKAAGLDAAEYSKRLLSGGKEAKFAMLEIAGALEGIEDPVEQANAAIALFGAPLEDLGTAAIPDFLLSLQDMGNDLGDVQGAAQRVADEVGGNTMARLETLKRKGLDRLAEAMETYVLPAFNAFLDWGEQHWPAIQATISTAVSAVVGFIQEHLPAIQATVTEVITAIVGFVEEHWPQVRDLIVTTFETVAAYVTEWAPRIWALIKQITTAIVELVQEHWPQIQQIITTAIETVQTVIDRVVKAIKGIWDRWGDDISAAASRVWGAIEETIGTSLDIIEGIFNTFKALFEGDWDAMWAEIQKVLDGALDLLETALDLAWDGIKGAAKLVWDEIEDTVEDTIDAVVGFVEDLPGRLVDWGTDLYNAGKDLFGQLASGLLEAISGIPGEIADKILGPLQDVADKVADVLGIGSVGRAIGDLQAEADAAAAADAALLESVAGNYTIPEFHAGGRVLASMGGNVPGIGRDEVLAKLKVGEVVINPEAGAGRGGPLVGTVVVNDGRSLADEIRLLDALYGGPAGMAAA